jgi:uncharacterized membrane protein YkvA (DUF1232 family)
MLWSGLIVMVVGVALRFGLSGGTAHWIGLAAIAAGALLVFTGLLLANRRRRKVRRRSGTTAAAVPIDYKTSGGRIAAMIIAVVYILSPIDFIPEFFLPFGVVDDIGALSWLAIAVGQEYSRHRQSRQALRG